MKPQFFIILVTLLSSCFKSSNSEKLKFSKEMFQKETSIVVKIKGDNYSKNDTLLFPISYFSNETLIVQIEGKNPSFSFVIYSKYRGVSVNAHFSSDYNQYYNKHSIDFEAPNNSLELSKSSYRVGDTIYGKINTGMFSIKDSIYFKHIDSISFKGNFAAIIEDEF